MSTSQPVCGNCKFWKLEEQDDDADAMGSCHRHAPRPTFEGPLIVAELVRDRGLVAITAADLSDRGDVEGWYRRMRAWPATGENEFCGEFAARLERKSFV